MIPAHSVAVTAMNVLDGVNHNTIWEEVQAALEEEGMGFIEFCIWVTKLAEHGVKLTEDYKDRDFPGVYDYEVSFVVGTHICSYIATHRELPPDEQVIHWFDVEAEDFFARGNQK